jgi:hypothetical protein
METVRYRVLKGGLAPHEREQAERKSNGKQRGGKS